MTGKTKNAQPQLTKEQKDKRRKALIKLGSITVLTALVLLFATIAWFTMNKETGTSGMGVKVKGKSFDLITLSDDQDNKNGAFYSPYHEAIQRGETEGYGIWLVDGSSNINNYSSSGSSESSLGIEPGSSGTITFYIKPYSNVTIDFTFQTIGYISGTETVEGHPRTTMTELSASEGDPACFLNGHILLFEHHDTFYSGFIPADGNGRRVLRKTFEVGGDYDADTNGDSRNDAYRVDIHWVWPETLDTLVYNATDAVMICDRDAASAQGSNDYQQVVSHICSYPQFFLKGLPSGTSYTEAQIKGKNAMYNDADQDIGMNVEYVLLRLSTDTSSGD